MKIYYGVEHIGKINNAVVTTGSFDGVHIGHKIILERLKKLAMESEGETVVITFHPHPRQVLYPESAGKTFFLISSRYEKIELLRKAGLHHLIILPFTREFSKMTSVAFVRNILLGRLHARKVVIGFNHHFGHNREGDYEALRTLGRQYGFDVEEIPEQDIQHELVNSARIRDALRTGDIEKANIYLDHYYMIVGRARKTASLLSSGGLSGFRIQLEEAGKLLPPDGTYETTMLDEDSLSRGICFIRQNREFPLNSVIEFHALDSRKAVSGKYITLMFHKKLHQR